MAGILEGIRVIDWSIFQQGPVASMILGDMGADVIKLEGKDGGDPGRAMMRIAGAILSSDLSQRNAYFEAGNRNKRAIAVDLTKPEGKEVIYKLVEKSDVFIQNFREGVAERLGMGYQTLRKLNPRLIYAHASAWGPKGPDKGDPSADYTGVARSGLMHLIGEPGMPPLMVQGGLGDQSGAVMTAMGVMSALYYREKTGIGQELESSLLGSLVFLMGHPVTMNTLVGLPTPKIARKKAGNPLWNYYQCGDGKWVAMAALAADKFWPNFCKALSLENLEKDPRFNSMETRRANGEALVTILDATFAKKDRAEWVKMLKETGMVYGIVNDIPDLKEDPQVLENDYITQYDHPIWGQVKMIGFPISFEKTPMAITREAPEYGQDTETILNEMLGYNWDQITALKDKKVI
ncbi:MAG: CoA transferase [Dehalococcoidia bacterium]|nr:CoA transferase [Dehalococcoidia bacterium]